MRLTSELTDIIKQRLRFWAAQQGIRFERLPAALSKNEESLLEQGIDFIIGHHLLKKGELSDLCFLQIGAFDGVAGDPIYPYAKEYGWKGTLVEPQKRYFSKLKENYRGVEGLQFMNVAIAHERGKRVLYTLEDPDAPDLPWWAPQIASFSRENVLKHSGSIKNLESRIKEEEVKCITFRDLIDKSYHNDIDILQVDVEGFDYQIIKMIDFQLIKPDIINFENKHLSDKEHSYAINILLEEEYKISVGGEDTTAYLSK